MAAAPTNPAALWPMPAVCHCARNLQGIQGGDASPAISLPLMLRAVPSINALSPAHWYEESSFFAVTLPFDRAILNLYGGATVFDL